MPKEEPGSEYTTTDGGGGDGVADDDYTRVVGVDNCYDPPKKEPEFIGGDGSADEDYGSAKEEPESKVIDIVYHPVKEEPEPALAAADDKAVADDVRDVGYACSHCCISLCTREFKVEHETRCKVRMKRKELESQITKSYHCGYCRCPFLNKELKEQHQQKYCRKRPDIARKRSNGTHFECDKCKYATKWKDSLARHVLRHDKNNAEWFTCTQCSYKTVYKRCMTRHMKIHDNTFSYCCSICGKVFRTKMCLDDHVVRQHFDESEEVFKLITSTIYTCNICDRFRTVWKNHFNIHLTVTHLKGVGRQKYQCSRCPYSTFFKGNLTNHSKRHEGQKEYQCTVCKKQFVIKGELDSHIVSNHADNVDLMKTITTKIHCCKSCSFKTVQIPNLKSHVRLKHI